MDVSRKPTLTQTILINKSLIIKAWIWCYFLGLAVVVATIALTPLHTYWYDLGAKLGNIAVVLLAVSLVPGIIRRFELKGIFTPFQLILMAFRRHLGISMFLAALLHVLYAYVLPDLKFALPLFPLNPSTLAGMIAFILAAPLFFTSNDISVRMMGTAWRKLHTMVYPMILLILLHLALLGGEHLAAYVAVAVLVLEVLSWSLKWIKAKRWISLGLLLLGLFAVSAAYASYTSFKPKSKELVQTPTAQTNILATVAKHATTSDCWTIIHGKVYNLTAYIQVHPGGVETIASACGVDGTTAFDTKGGRGTHSQTAVDLLANYLVDTTTSSPTPIATAAITPAHAVLPKQSPVSQRVTLNAATVAAHSSQNDCWIIVSGNVYNVTQYIPYHPGGVGTIVNNCGSDATVAFSTKGGRGSHSSNAWSLLAGYLIGSLNSSAVIAPTPTPDPNATPTPIIRANRYEDD